MKLKRALIVAVLALCAATRVSALGTDDGGANDNGGEESSEETIEGPIYILPIGPLAPNGPMGVPPPSAPQQLLSTGPQPQQQQQQQPATFVEVAADVHVGNCVNCMYSSSEAEAHRFRELPKIGETKSHDDIFLIPYKHNPLENQNLTAPFNTPPAPVVAGMADSPFAAQAALGVFPTQEKDEEKQQQQQADDGGANGGN